MSECIYKWKCSNCGTLYDSPTPASCPKCKSPSNHESDNLPIERGTKGEEPSDSCDCSQETAWERIADGIRWLLIWAGIGLAAALSFYGCQYVLPK